MIRDIMSTALTFKHLVLYALDACLDIIIPINENTNFY